MPHVDRCQIDFPIPRYLSQLDGVSCGPVALANYLKWAKLPATIDNLPDLGQLCGHRPKIGTFNQHMSRAIGFRPSRATWEKFREHLASGGSAILSTRKPCRRNGHFWFAAGITDDYRILCVNLYVGKTLYMMSYQEAVYFLQYSSLWRFTCKPTPLMTKFQSIVSGEASANDLALSSGVTGLTAGISSVDISRKRPATRRSKHSTRRAVTQRLFHVSEQLGIEK